MFLNPKFPEAPTVPTSAVMLPAQPAQPVQQVHVPAACACQHTAAPVPAPRRPVAPLIAAGAGGVAAVIAIGVVLTALLTAVAVGAVSVAVCAVSVAVCAVVLRSLLADHNRRR
ncbi:hypothetical protein NGB36_28510 [Streptomyces sp. RB6PN25]|uniref:SpdD-like protein n=1 Tax=Streptomyces humicola TaxID=2953240 RepID=A0ABT1Q3B6_9ACTN|nr:hypothetical protein [Streptomyces humicola]MCQ4084416.1 hypothetical protein [Streptomyces humicola]